MKLLTNPCNFKNAIDLIKFGIDQISIGESKFSTRNSCDINLKQIEKLTKIKNKTQILVLVNKFFFDPQLPELEKYLVSLAKLNIDGIIFSDYAVNQILFEHKIKINQIYSPETLVVNYGQFDFYKQNKITEVALARELTKLNIQKILLNKKNIKVQLQVCGYAFMMWSRWDLLKNFRKSHKIKENLTNQILYLEEERRKEPFIIFEDENGTCMFTKYNLNLLSKLKELSQYKIDTVRIDTFLHNEKWIIESAKIFKEVIEKIKNNDSDLEKFIADSTNLLSKYDKVQSCGFYESSKKDLIYLLDEKKQQK